MIWEWGKFGGEDIVGCLVEMMWYCPSLLDVGMLLELLSVCIGHDHKRRVYDFFSGSSTS